MKTIALVCAMLYPVYTVVAQNSINIKVIDRSTQSILAGASVHYDNKVYATNNNGICVLPCKAGIAINISYVGYAPYSAVLNNCSDMVAALYTDTSYLDYVEITATSNQNKAVLYQPASISKMGLTEIKRGQGIFFDDAIQTNVPGVQMNRRTVAGGQQFNIRGYGNGTRGTRGVNSNFDGQGYKVYLNGIPITDAEGITTMDDIDFGSIGNAEIVKGPAGTLYGQAIAGTINLKTITPEKGKTLAGQELQVGNYGLRRYTTTFQAGGERSALLLNYGKQTSDGFATHNTSHKDFVNFTFQVKAAEKQSFSAYIGYTESYDERLGELTPAQWAANDYSGNIEYLKRDAHSHVSTFRAGLSHTYAFSKAISNTTALFGSGFRSDVSSAGGWTDKTAINYGLRSTFDVRLNLTKDLLLSGLTGIEMQQQDAQVLGYSMKQPPNDTTTDGWNFSKPYWVVNAATSNTAFVTNPTVLFSQWSLHFPKDLTVTAGLSFNSQRIVLDDRFNASTPSRPSRFAARYHQMISPYMAINKVFSKRFSLYASYSTGYKAPVSAYFFITTPTVASPPIPATARVNDRLKPEKGMQWELGTKGVLAGNRLYYQLAIFRTLFADKMTSVSVPLNNSATAYSYVVNGGTQIHKGVELSMKYSVIRNKKGIISNLTPFINVAFSDFTYGDNFKYITGTSASTLDTFDYSRKAVFGVPRITNAIGIDADFSFGVYATLSTLYKGGFTYALEKVGNAPKTFMPRSTDAYNLINLKIGYRRTVGERWKLDVSVGVNNLAGEKYPLMVFVNQLPDAFIPAPPQAVVFGGIQVKYLIR